MDIILLLAQYLKIDPAVVSEIVSTYPNPLEQIFYLFFFPTIFIILFLIVLMNSVLRRAELSYKIKLLVAIAFYIFIIIQGFYTIFVLLSKIWFILIFIIAFIWFIGKHFGKPKTGGLPALERAKRIGALTGTTKLEKDIETKIEQAEKLKVKEDPDAIKVFNDLLEEIDWKMDELKKQKPLAYLRLKPRYEALRK